MAVVIPCLGKRIGKVAKQEIIRRLLTALFADWFSELEDMTIILPDEECVRLAIEIGDEILNTNVEAAHEAQSNAANRVNRIKDDNKVLALQDTSHREIQQIHPNEERNMPIEDAERRDPNQNRRIPPPPPTRSCPQDVLPAYEKPPPAPLEARPDMGETRTMKMGLSPQIDSSATLPTLQMIGAILNKEAMPIPDARMLQVKDDSLAAEESIINMNPDSDEAQSKPITTSSADVLPPPRRAAPPIKAAPQYLHDTPLEDANENAERVQQPPTKTPPTSRPIQYYPITGQGTINAPKLPPPGVNPRAHKAPPNGQEPLQAPPNKSPPPRLQQYDNAGVLFKAAPLTQDRHHVSRKAPPPSADDLELRSKVKAQPVIKAPPKTPPPAIPEDHRYIDGTWENRKREKITIGNDTIFWNHLGTGSAVNFKYRDNVTITAKIDSIDYVGTVVKGCLEWSDGDVWKPLPDFEKNGVEIPGSLNIKTNSDTRIKGTAESTAAG